MTKTNENENPKNIPDLIPLSKWNDYYDYPTIGALRQFVFFKKQNGFDKVLRTFGTKKRSRLYIKVSAFFDWVEEINKVNAV